MKHIRNLISVLLVVITICVIMMPMTSALLIPCNCSHVPMIYVHGRQATFDDPNSPNRQELNKITEEELKQIVTDALPYLKDAILTDDYTEYCNVVSEGFIKAIGEFGLSKTGEVDNKSGIRYNWNPKVPNTLKDTHKKDDVSSYVFLYDARRDPFAVADDLKTYVDAVKRVTGHKTVNIIARCMGAQYSLAYFVKYGWSDVETFVQNCTSANGTDVMSELFAGKIEINQDALDRYVAEEGETDDPFGPALLNFLVQTRTLGLGTAVVNSIYKKTFGQIIPQIMIKEYGTCPGYWSMVSTKDYAAAKKLIFGGREKEYQTLISKLDNYNKLVRTQTNTILQKMHDDGVKICTIVKYGFQMQPITESYDLQSDDKISVKFQSYGAYCALQGNTLSALHIQNRKSAGKGKYISPDKLIDASTCLFPDTTWFVKDMRHNDFRGAVNPLYVAACRAKTELTVDSDEKYPQFLRYYYDENTLKPLTVENSETVEYNDNFFVAFVRFFKLLLEKIRTWFNNIVA